MLWSVEQNDGRIVVVASDVKNILEGNLISLTSWSKSWDSDMMRCHFSEVDNKFPTLHLRTQDIRIPIFESKNATFDIPQQHQHVQFSFEASQKCTQQLRLWIVQWCIYGIHLPSSRLELFLGGVWWTFCTPNHRSTPHLPSSSKTGGRSFQRLVRRGIKKNFPTAKIWKCCGFIERKGLLFLLLTTQWTHGHFKSIFPWYHR